MWNRECSPSRHRRDPHKVCDAGADLFLAVVVAVVRVLVHVELIKHALGRGIRGLVEVLLLALVELLLAGRAGGERGSANAPPARLVTTLIQWSSAWPANACAGRSMA